MVRDKLIETGNALSTVYSGSRAAIVRQINETIAKFEAMRDKIPVYELQPDGTITRTWENPNNNAKRAYDLSHNHRNQFFARGYSNPLDIKVNDLEEGDIDLIASEKYQTYMKQKVLSDSMMAGSDTMTQVKYLTLANIGLLIIAIVIGVSMAT